MTDNGKPNGTGADNVLVKIGDTITTLYEITGTPETDRLYIAANGTRFTDTAWEQAAMATAGGGQLYTQPPSALTDRPINVTELRMSNTEPIVMNVCARGEAGMQIMSVSSCDPNKNGIREMLRKVKVTVPCLMTLCGNKRNQFRAQQEVNKTLSVVCPIMVPGSIVHVAKRSKTCFQDVVRDIHTGRSRPIENKEAVAYSIVYTHMFGSFYAALTNRLNGIPFEINLPVQAAMEWATFYIQQYTEGVMETSVIENLSRMIQGYTARGISWFMWIKTIEALARPDGFLEKEEIIKDLLMDIHADALPITAIPSVLVCLVSRTVDASWLMMAMISARALGVPVISWNGLNRFFKDDEPPTEAGVYKDEYTMIREFITTCIDNHRFCADTDDDFDKNGNISCYITGDGRDSMLPLHENKGFLRLVHNNKEKPGDDNCVFSRLASRVQREEGAALFKDCHMGPEKCIYKNALKTCTTKALDLRGLGSEFMYCTEKHFKKMGLMGYLPGLKDYTMAEAPVFAKQICFRERDQVKSVGLGINAWSMLALLAVTGEILVSPGASDLFAHGIVKHVLDNSPSGMTPGNIAPTRSFNSNTDPVKLYITDLERPIHFLRPHDEGFPITGVLSIGKAIHQYLPEDFLHCTALPSIAETLGCDILEIPSEAVKVSFLLKQWVSAAVH